MSNFNNRSILYLHGYDSSSQGNKPQLLRQLYPHNPLLIPDLPLDPIECMKLTEDTLCTAPNDTIIIGASLGGFFAYYLAAKYQKDCLLINPVFQPAMEAKKLLEKEPNHDRKKVLLTAADVYLSYSSHLDKMKHPTNCFVALGDKDTTIDPAASSLHFSDAFVKNYPDDHYMFESFNTVMREFEDFLQEKI